VTGLFFGVHAYQEELNRLATDNGVTGRRSNESRGMY
jgi:hypothetical protein